MHLPDQNHVYAVTRGGKRPRNLDDPFMVRHVTLRHARCHPLYLLPECLHQEMLYQPTVGENANATDKGA